MASLNVKTEQVIDGIMLSNNSIGYINYESLVNKPKFNFDTSKNYVTGTYTNNAGYSNNGIWVDMTNGLIHTPCLYTTTSKGLHLKNVVIDGTMTVDRLSAVDKIIIDGPLSANGITGTSLTIGDYNVNDITQPTTDINGNGNYSVRINSNTIVKAAFQCYDLCEQKKTKGNAVGRTPICSAETDGNQISYLSSGTDDNGKKQIHFRGQWEKNITNFIQTYINIDGESDIRLKENIENSTINALNSVMNMKVRQFDWKETRIHQPLGLVADELEEIDPLLTIGGGYNPDKTMNIKSIDRLLLSEYAIKAIQEQQIIIEKQQKEIDNLKKVLNIK